MHQAITLGQSLLEHNPDYKFIIGLVDIIDERVDKTKLPPYEILEVATVMKPDMLYDMTKRYNIIELNTSVKPFYFNYLFEKYNPEFVIYFDPDICIYNKLSTIESLFDKDYNLLVTPHSNSPREIGYITDIAFIHVGIFNFGFVALKNHADSKNLVDWWQKRLYESCYINTPMGLFVDQLWMNLSVCYCDRAFILKDEGYNMAPWNLHERKLNNDEHFIVNNKTPLTFFHFSGITDQEVFTKSKDPSLTFSNRPDLKTLFANYNKQLLINNKNYFKIIECKYTNNRLYPTIYVKKVINKLIGKLIAVNKKL